MPQFKSMNPFECRLWAFHDRLGDLINEQSCSAEIQSFARYGQLVAALGRPLHGDPNHKVELIYGARRLFVAQHLNLPLKVELREISDRDGIIAMDIENRMRLDISPYERGLSYSKWIKAGQFKSQDEIARALRVSASQISRLLALAKLPTVIVQAFSNPAAIRENWGIEILRVLEDPQQRHAVIQEARNTIRRANKLDDRRVYRALLAASTSDSKVKSRVRDEVVVGENGLPLFRIRYYTKSIAVQLPTKRLSTGSLENIRRALIALLADPKQSSAPDNSEMSD
jgi:ParB family transcriptional regulator, chromosome partitioning protein